MNISQFLDQTIASLKKVDWEQVPKDLINLWVTCFKAMVALAVITYLTGRALGHGIHRLNDWLAAKWLQVLRVAGPTELGRTSPTNIEIIKETIAVEVEMMLPPANTEVNETPVLDEQPPPPARRSRRKSPPPVLVQPEVGLSQARRPRGRREHNRRQHQAA